MCSIYLIIISIYLIDLSYYYYSTYFHLLYSLFVRFFSTSAQCCNYKQTLSVECPSRQNEIARNPLSLSRKAKGSFMKIFIRWKILQSRNRKRKIIVSVRKIYLMRSLMKFIALIKLGNLFRLDLFTDNKRIQSYILDTFYLALFTKDFQNSTSNRIIIDKISIKFIS